MPVVRTAIRVRTQPDRKGSVVGESGIHTSDIEKSSVLLRTLHPSNGSIQIHKFNADLVLPIHAPQSALVDAFELPTILDLALGGISSAVMTYGQTGSGKTFSMFGPPNLDLNSDPSASAASAVPSALDPAQYEGLIPRFLRLALSHPDVRSGRTSCRLAFYEIYNESVRDLLSNEGGLAPRWNRKLHTFVIDGLCILTVDSLSDAVEALREGLRNRHVGTHALNATSSRSHAVVNVYFESSVEVGVDEGLTGGGGGGGGGFLLGKVCFADLAGSERVGSTKASGAALLEASKINGSLLALGRVFRALAVASGPPRRNSGVSVGSGASEGGVRSSSRPRSASLGPGGGGGGGNTDRGGAVGGVGGVGGAAGRPPRASRPEGSAGATSSSAGGGEATRGRFAGGHVVRESVLTQCLYDVLSGRGRVWVLVCVSPASDSADESLRSLRFAEGASVVATSTVETEGRVHRHSDHAATAVLALRRELARVRGDLAAAETRAVAAEKRATEAETALAAMARAEGSRSACGSAGGANGRHGRPPSGSGRVSGGSRDGGAAPSRSSSGVVLPFPEAGHSPPSSPSHSDAGGGGGGGGGDRSGRRKSGTKRSGGSGGGGGWGDDGSDGSVSPRTQVVAELSERLDAVLGAYQELLGDYTALQHTLRSQRGERGGSEVASQSWLSPSEV